MKRPVTDREGSLVLAIAEKLDAEQRTALLSDLARSTVAEESEDGSRITFEIAGYERPPYRGQHPFPVTGRVRDADDAVVMIMLHADENNRLLELELVRWSDGNLKGPKWETLEVGA